MRTGNLWLKSAFAVLALVVGLSGLMSCAQATPTPTVEATPTPTVEATPTPTVEATPTPTVEATPTPTVEATPTPTAPAVKPIKWRMPGSLPVPDTSSVHTQKWVDLVRERTGGRLDITFYANTLTPSSEAPAAVMRGTVEIAQLAIPYAAQVIPFFDGFSLPFLGLTREQWKPLLIVGGEVSTLTQEVSLENGLVFLAFWSNGTMHMATNKPLRTVADWKGARVRVVGRTLSTVVKSVGAEVFTLTGDEAGDALKRGMIDATLSGPPVAISRGYGDAMSEWDEWSIFDSIMALAVNKQAFDSLPADVRKIMVDTAAEIEKEVWDATGKDIDDAVAVMKKKGVEFYTPAPAEMARMVELANEFNEDWATMVGPDGAKFLEIVAKARGY